MMLSVWQRTAESRWGRLIAISVALVAIVLSAVQPLTYGLIPASPNVYAHLYRLIALDHAIRSGDLWPRYVSGLMFGYGAPLFNTVSPLYLYPFEALHLIGLSFIHALMIGMIGYMLIAAVGAFLFGRLWGGTLGGLLTAAGYVYAPYLLAVWPRQGDLAGYAALALLPWAMWAFWRLARHGKRGDFLLTVVLYSLFMLMHPPTTFICTPLLAAYALYLWWTSPDPPSALIRLAAAAIMALGLAAFFWIPLLFEASYTHLGEIAPQGVAPQETLASVLSFPHTTDLTQMAAPIPRTLSWPLIVLALMETGFIAWQKLREGKETGHFWMILFAILVLLYAMMATQLSTLLWTSLRPLRLLGDPHQFLGPASLFLAALGGYGAVGAARHIDSLIGKALWAGLCAVTICAYALPSLYVLYAPNPAAQHIFDAQNYERSTGRLATGIGAEYLPMWSTEPPDADALLGLYAEYDIIPRLQPSSEVTHYLLSWQAMGGQLDLEAHHDTRLIFNWLYFPGWWARIDGQPVPVEPTGSQGYLSIEVPEGRHQIEVGFGPTPLRLAAMITSSVFVAATLIFNIFFRKGVWLKQPIERSLDLYGTRWMLGAVFAACLALFAIKALWIDHAQTPIKRARFADGIDQELQAPLGIIFNDEIKLLGYDLTPQPVASGREAELTLYWQLVDEALSADYSTVIYLRDEQNQTLVTLTSDQPGGLPTSEWVSQLYAAEQHTLYIPEGTPPGVYSLVVGLYRRDQLVGLEAVDAQGNRLGITPLVGSIGVRRAAGAAHLPTPRGGIAVNKPISDLLTLLWVDDLPDSLNVGDPFAVTWAWRAQADLNQAYSAQLLWWRDKELHAASPLIPLVGSYATDQWRRRDAWRGLHTMHVPGRLETGIYEVAVLLIDAQNVPVGEPVTITEMHIAAPERHFEAPMMQIEADIVWQNLINLIGYDLPRTRITGGNALNMTLYWQPQTDIDQSLSVVLQLVDTNGAVVAEQESIPIRGTRLTTSWAPDEVLADTYALYIPPTLPEGTYRVRIGWIEALTGHQIPLIDSSAFWLMPQRIEVRAP